jgi:hypothetical protein
MLIGNLQSVSEKHHRSWDRPVSTAEHKMPTKLFVGRRQRERGCGLEGKQNLSGRCPSIN